MRPRGSPPREASKKTIGFGWVAMIVLLTDIVQVQLFVGKVQSLVGQIGRRRACECLRLIIGI